MMTYKLQFLLPNNVVALAIFPLIIVRKGVIPSKKMIRHEKLHHLQQLELTPLLFILWYFIEYLIKYIKYKDWNLAYENISFEREAYENESNPYYFNERKPYSFIKYL